MKKKGEFWPDVRERIWAKAEEIYMWENRHLSCNKPERNELMEAGYFYRAKLIVLRDLNRRC